MQATRFTIRPLIIRTKSEFFPHGTNNNEFISASHNRKQNVEQHLQRDLQSYSSIIRYTSWLYRSKLITFNWTNPGRVHISEWANTKKYVPTVLIYIRFQELTKFWLRNMYCKAILPSTIPLLYFDNRISMMSYNKYGLQHSREELSANKSTNEPQKYIKV